MSYVGNLKYDEDILKTDRDIVIYGAGKRGKQVLDYLERNNCKNRVVAFCDKSKELQQTSVEGVKVLTPEYAVSIYPEAEYIAYGRYVVEYAKRLEKLKVKNIHILL